MNLAFPDISLPRFEGPLDLLLSLIRKNEVDIADIPIAEITRQYLDYVHQAGELNVNLGAEFIYMAALLIHIKSRCLLAQDPELASSREDPRAELMRQLLDHDQVRQGAEFLKQKLELAEAAWTRTSTEDFGADSADEGLAVDGAAGGLNLLQILRLAQHALAAARTYELVNPPESVTVEEMGRWLSARLSSTEIPVDGTALLYEQPDGPHRMALFLAMLDMAKESRIHLEQYQSFGSIWVAMSDNVTPVP